MARDHARIKMSGLDDPDIRSLTSTEQAMYFLHLVGNSLTSYAGVMPYVPSEIAKRAVDLTDSKVKAAVKTLEQKRFVLTDPRTHELLVRTYVRHDGLFDRSNMGKAVAAAVARIMSERLKEAVLDELARCRVEQKSKPGWFGFQTLQPEMYLSLESRLQ